MFKRVLVGIDHRGDDRASLFTMAAQLSRECGSQLVLAHLTEITPLRSGVAREPRSAVETMLNDARNAIEALDGKVEGIVEAVPGLERPAEALADLAREHECDLVLLGSHGHNAWVGALIGSLSQRAATYSPCPVLLVPCKG
jgi:nucleotide-binding universal stress UspA family protein